ncbi:hypothetical protein Plhal304r1_c003g0012841 [Plasmopara halstedii]
MVKVRINSGMHKKLLNVVVFEDKSVVAKKLEDAVVVFLGLEVTLEKLVNIVAVFACAIKW